MNCWQTDVAVCCDDPQAAEAASRWLESLASDDLRHLLVLDEFSTPREFDLACLRLGYPLRTPASEVLIPRWNDE